MRPSLWDTCIRRNREDPEVQDDIKEINELNAQSSGKLSWRELFSNGKDMNLWRFSCACGSQAMQQITGINLVTYYGMFFLLTSAHPYYANFAPPPLATTVFESSLQFDGKLSRFMTAWLGTEHFITACLALFVVDRFGRRNLMMFGAGGLAISLLVIGASLLHATDSNRKPAIVATVFIFVYDTALSIEWLRVTWLYPAEITPIRIRTETNGFSTCSNW
jgi:MFS family permease